jgi:metal-responsive CopG/Arc/MetJ family transcriptional regulator
MTMVRTNVTLPAELLAKVDELAGPRGRSQFVADAVTKSVKRERQRAALEALDGVFIGGPNQMSPEETYAWIRSLRDDAR